MDMETVKEYKTYSNLGKKFKSDKRYTKRSLQAKMVADEVVDRIKNGKKINLQDIHVRNGYSRNSAIAQKALQTKTYQDTVTPVLEKMERIRNKALTALLKRDVTNEKYNVLIDGVDKLTKNTQLLSGKATENVANNIVVFNDKDPLARQTKEA